MMHEATNKYIRFTMSRLYEREKQLQEMQQEGDCEEINAELEAVQAEIEERER